MLSTLSKNETQDDHFSSSNLQDFAEYHSAKRRFYSEYHFYSSNMSEDDIFLDDLIQKFCGDYEEEVKFDSSLFFRLLFRSDFLQLSQNAKPKFYERICSVFILTDKIVDLLEALDDLDLIPHVKTDILNTLMKILNLQLVFAGNRVTLTYISRGTRFGLQSSSIAEHMIISPSAYKILLGKFELSYYHLNFLIRLLQVKMLTLDDCNLNWKDGNILNGLVLRSLHLSRCGTRVNKIIEENFDNLRENLLELDISECPLYDSTLELIGQLSLNKLNVRNSIKKHGYFIGDLWTELADFGSSEESYVDINILWKDNGLRDTVKYLDVSCNDIDITDMEEILQLDLTELNVTRSNEIWSREYLNLWRNSLQNLRVLRMRETEIDFAILSVLFELKLETFEFSYDAVKNFNDFSVLLQAPMSKSLQELTIDLKNHCQPFVHFLSKLKLKYFECKLGTWYYYNFDVFWNAKNRKHLETLILKDGKISETDAKGIGALKLKTLSLYPFLFDSKEHFLKILKSENLRYSVTDLSMGGAYELDKDHLNLLLKFKNLRKLSLKISGTNLTKVFTEKIEYFKNLKELELKVYIGLNVDEQAAKALCSLPDGTNLTIVLIGLGKKWPLTFTEQARQVFAMQNFLFNSENPVHLELSDCSLDYRCGRIFKNFNIRSLVLNSCVLENFWVSFLEDEIIFTLQNLIMKRVDVDHGQLLMLRNLCLNELSILTSLDDFGYNKLPVILSGGAIAKSLFVLRLGPYSCIPYIEYISKSKMSVYELFPIELL